ncbi:hypothetical protein BEWA_019590 [Theileria equi strain WA]|uniref:Uncharacterized protein n=1 Tax=Theileria equi strain WA TaxID=1537102 RepID=L0AV36_THEEQ|nr:hypothetical protein BEWA_019590 [Theileria equi strain WA]AFZ79113.1 hypothetical protein BEWA_019590 [Theileria equi strain WA]|eukprot:XP_004828779.1 hypothetical protein BEWA_019590 [Theileria equi strain WA]
MAETVKLKRTTTQPRKAKRFETNKYKDYLFGPIDAFDMEWANTVLEYNPELKLDTRGLNKYSSHNLSISTDGGSHTSLIGNTDLDFYESKNHSIPDSLETGLSASNLPLSKNTSGLDDVHIERYKDDIKRLEAERDALNEELNRVNSERETDKKDANLYRAFQKQIQSLNMSIHDKLDTREKLEQILGGLYTFFSESFGTDNSLSSILEEFANLYLKQQSDIQVELASMRSQLKIVNDLDKMINKKSNYEEMVEQRVKTIDLLVDQLKITKSESSQEINKLKNELVDTQVEFGKKLSNAKSMCKEYETENRIINEMLNSTRNSFNKLMHDQHELISQLPLATLENCNGEQTKESRSETQLKSVDGKNILESLVQDLYRRNEDSLAVINQKDHMIQQLYGTISRLQRNLKEWENDAILWLDYVEQSNCKHN